MSTSIRTFIGALTALLSVILLPVSPVGALEGPPPPPPGSDSPAAGYLHPVNPARVLDTRNGTGASGAAGPAKEISLQVTGRGGVPATASAVVLNVTVTAPTESGYVTVYPSGSTRPVASNLNFSAGQTRPNLVVTKVGADGKVKLFNSSGNTHLVADVMGWYDDIFGSMMNVPAGASRSNSMAPARLLDTRKGSGAVRGGNEIEVQITGNGGIPQSATAVALNVTAVQPTTNGYVTAYPSGTTRPTTSNLNFQPRQVVPNMVIAKVGTNGRIKLFNSSGSTHLIVDATAYFTPVNQVLSGGEYTPLSPARILDTRSGSGAPKGKVTAGHEVSLKVAGAGGVMDGDIDSVVLNVTVTQPTATGYVSVYPSEGSRPTSSNLNFVPNQTVPNLVIAKVGSDGRVKLFNSSGSTHLIADVVGFYNSGNDTGGPGGQVPWNSQPADGAPEMGSAAALNPSLASDQKKFWAANDPQAAMLRAQPTPLLTRGSDDRAAAGSTTTSRQESVVPNWDRTPFRIWSEGYTYPGYDIRIGRLVFWIGSEGRWSSCSATMVARNLAITANHCLTDPYGTPNQYFAFFAGLSGNTANGGIYTNVVNAIYPVVQNTPAYLTNNYGYTADWGFIKFGATNGRYPGDSTGYFPIMINPTNISGLQSFGYPSEGSFFSRYCSSTRTQNDANCYLYTTWGAYGGYNQSPSGWFEIGWGSNMSGGASGGPVFAYENGTAYIVSVNSNGKTEQCDQVDANGGCAWRRHVLNMWGPWFTTFLLDVYRANYVR